jgi:molecular chaperone GrpE
MAGEEAARRESVGGEDACATPGRAEFDPLFEIEQDVRRLLKDYSVLRQETDEYREKTESDFKKLLLSFIEVADAFENVWRNINPKLNGADPQAKKWAASFKTVYRMLIRALSGWDVVPIETMVGEKADPLWHKVLEAEEDPGRENGAILEEIKKGYLWKGRLLRSAEVRAVNNP